MLSFVTVLLAIAVLPVGLMGVTQSQDWSTAQPIVTGLGPDSRSNSLDIDIAVDSDGTWHMVYFELGSDGEDITYDILYANSHAEQAVLGHVVLQPGVNGTTAGGPTIATGQDGSCHAAYRVIEFSNNVVTGNHILYTNNLSGSWSTPQPIISGLGPDSRSNAFDIDIAVDSDGAWHLVFFELGSDGVDITYDILYANSNSETATLAHTVMHPGANGATAEGPTIGLGPDGSCHVAYRHMDFVSNDVVNNCIFYTNNVSGSWSIPQPIVSGLGPDSRSNSLDIDIAVDSDGAWHLVFFEQGSDGEDITYDILYANSNSETATLAHTVMHPGANGATAEGPTIALAPDGSCHVAYRHIGFVSNEVVNNYIMYKHRVSPFPDALVLEPDPILAIMTNAIDPTTGAIFIGDEFDIGYNAADINITGLLINNTIPVTAAILTTHPLLEGEALALSFPLDVFADGYGLIWDSTIQTYLVTGEFNDTSPFSTGDEFFFLGRISGDLTLDGRIDISDVVLMVEWFFCGGAPPVIIETADVDASGGTDISDLLYLADYMFADGPAPVHP